MMEWDFTLANYGAVWSIMVQLGLLLLFLLAFAAGSLLNACIACGIFFVLWAVYTVYLFRRSIFKKKYAGKPAPVWQEEKK